MSLRGDDVLVEYPPIHDEERGIDGTGAKYLLLVDDTIGGMTYEEVKAKLVAEPGHAIVVTI